MIPISKFHYTKHKKKKKSFTAEDKTIQDISIRSVQQTFFFSNNWQDNRFSLLVTLYRRMSSIWSFSFLCSLFLLLLINWDQLITISYFSSIHRTEDLSVFNHCQPLCNKLHTVRNESLVKFVRLVQPINSFYFYKVKTMQFKQLQHLQWKRNTLPVSWV